jgi:RimJ/RimL family protein N-acetyltransferase
MLFGSRVRLRAIERADIPAFVRWFNDPEVRHYLTMYEPMSAAKEERWFEAQLEARDDRILAIEAHADEEWTLIGNCGLHRLDWKNRQAVLGIVLGEKRFWGQGYGSDAVRTLLRFAFGELNLHRIELEVVDYNPRARRCYERIGFQLEGTRRQAHYHAGQYHDMHLMSVLREEFGH